MQKLVSSRTAARANILSFENTVSHHSKLRDKLGYFRAWYAERGADGIWKVGPSKFIGYDLDSPDHYVPYELDGKETEQQLRQWYREIDGSDPRFNEIDVVLKQFLANHRKRPSSLYRISVAKNVTEGSRSVGDTDAAPAIVDLVIAVCRTLSPADRARVRTAL